MTDSMDLEVIPPEDAKKIEKVIMQGDLGALTVDQRMTYIRMICQSLGINPFTRPFEYLVLNNKLTLYARKDCTDQLRKVNKIAIQILERVVDRESGIAYVRVKATMPDGKEDEDIGAVGIINQTGTELANSLMKATTKAKRRVTLSISGLGFTDESEVPDIPNNTRTTPAKSRRIQPTPVVDTGMIVTIEAPEPSEKPAEPEKSAEETLAETLSVAVPEEKKEDAVRYVPAAAVPPPATSGKLPKAGAPRPTPGLPRPLPPTVAPVNFKK